MWTLEMLTSREKWQNPSAKDHNEDPKRLSEMQSLAGVAIPNARGIGRVVIVRAATVGRGV